MISEVVEHNLRLAAVYDDDSPAWRDFYPHDLPDDWRLAYCAHYWRNLLIPAGAWERFTTNTDWVSDVPDTLRLYFEMPDESTLASEVFIRLASALGPRLGGILSDGRVEPPSEPCLRGCWFVQVPAPAIAGVDAAVAFASSGSMALLLRPESGLTLPRWRAVLEQVHASALGSANTLVFLRVGPEELEAAETILRLSGLQRVASKD